MSVIIDLQTVCVANVSPILDLTSDECEPIAVFYRCVVDLSIDNDAPIVSVKRCIVDLSVIDDDIVFLPIIKRQRPLNDNREFFERELLIEKLRKLPRDLLMKIFDDYLDVIFIKEIFMTPKDILRSAISIHHASVSRIVPYRTLTNISTITRFIIGHLREKATLFITYAMRNSVVLSSLQVNDSFVYCEPNKVGIYIVLKVSRNSAIVQRIKYPEKKLYYKGLIFNTVEKMSPKKRICMKILKNKCIFNPEREKSICFINNYGHLTEIVYYVNGGLIVEKRRNMLNYIIE